jgi:hypothetical protein
MMESYSDRKGMLSSLVSCVFGACLLKGSSPRVHNNSLGEIMFFPYHVQILAVY